MLFRVFLWHGFVRVRLRRHVHPRPILIPNQVYCLKRSLNGKRCRFE